SLACQARGGRLLWLNWLITLNRNSGVPRFRQPSWPDRPKSVTDAARNSCWDFLSALEFHNIRDGLGLSTASLVAFLVGFGCALFALLAGVIYSEKTL